MTVLRAGIIGTGRAAGPGVFEGVAGRHLNGYLMHSDVELAGLYDLIPEQAREWAVQQKIPHVPIYERLEDLLDKIDLVSICTPNSTHVDLSLKALRAGVAVLCEKPLSRDYAEAKAAAQAADQLGRTHMINFGYRWMGAVRFMRDLVEEGRLGELYWGRMQFSTERHADTGAGMEWRFDRSISGQGVLADLAVHCVDLARFLLGPSAGEVVAVSGSVTTAIPARRTPSGLSAPVTNEDVAAFVAEMSGGGLVSFSVSRIGFGSWIQAEFCGSGGAMRFDGADPGHLECRLKSRNGPYSSSWEKVKVPDRYLDRVSDPLVPIDLVIDEFVAAVRERRPAVPDFWAGAAAQRVIEAVECSAVEGRRIMLAEIGPDARSRLGPG